MNPADSPGRDAEDWARRLVRGELSPRQLRRLNRWLRVKEHQQELARTVAAHHDSRASPVPSALHSPAAPNEIHWKTAITVLAAFLLVGVGTLFLLRERQTTSLRFATHVGEIKQFPLADGSDLWLNTDSQVSVRYSESNRDVDLISGEGRFRVNRDPKRPFRVTAGSATIRAIGTEFSVRVKDPAHVETLVVQGSVLVDAGHGRAEPARAGELLIADRAGRIARETLDSPERERRLAWKEARITFTGESVAEGVAEFNRYHDIKIVVLDPTAAARPLGGTFNVSDVEGFVSGLNITFGLRPDPTNRDASQIRLIAVEKEESRD